jgi:hypothetical protein
LGQVRRQRRLAADRHPGHNLLRWVAAIGLGARGELVAAKTLRRTLLALARLRCIAYAT